MKVEGVIVIIDYGEMRIENWLMEKVGMVKIMVMGDVFGVIKVEIGIEMMI